ncbi:hypothetical protein J6590_029774 [Homalodisca vitripennis]|nr:hypothetical protein J6590_029774 [Homalodisca vitripennis]
MDTYLQDPGKKSLPELLDNKNLLPWRPGVTLFRCHVLKSNVDRTRKKRSFLGATNRLPKLSGNLELTSAVTDISRQRHNVGSSTVVGPWPYPAVASLGPCLLGESEQSQALLVLAAPARISKGSLQFGKCQRAGTKLICHVCNRGYNKAVVNRGPTRLGKQG